MSRRRPEASPTGQPHPEQQDLGADERALHEAALRAAERWADRDLAAYASARVRTLAAGSTTDWGLSAAADRPRRPPISLAGGIPDAATQPREALLEAMQRALATPDDAPLVYGGGRGYEPLREQIAAFFARDQRPAPGPDAFVLTNGAAGAIDLVCAALIDPGDVVLSEVPTFTGSLRTFVGHGAEIVGIHLDAEGIRLDDLEAAVGRLRRDGRRLKLLYTIPTFQNPTGIDTSRARREALLELAAREGLLILEDTAYAELFFGRERAPSLSALAGGHGVVTAGTFSKTIATGLRVGWVQAPRELIGPLLATRFDMGNSPLLHRMLSAFMESGEFEDHVEAMRALYRRKVEAIGSALRDPAGAGRHVAFETPAGGFFLWLRLLGGLRATDVQAAAMEEGVVFPVGEAFYPGRDPGDDGEHIRLAYSWTAEADLEEAARRIAMALGRVARGDA